MKKSAQTLLSQLDLSYATGDIGHVLLLSNNFTNIAFTSTSGSGTNLTVSSIAGLGDGTKVRLSTTDTLPADLELGTDYWLTSRDGATAVKLSTSYDNYVSNTYVSHSDAGIGTHTIIEQAFTEIDFTRGLLAKTALINKELSHADYSRKILNLPVAEFDFDNNWAIKKYQTSWVKVDPAAFEFQYVLTMIGSTGTIGNTTGTPDSLHQYATLKTVLTTQAINLEFING